MERYGDEIDELAMEEAEGSADSWDGAEEADEYEEADEAEEYEHTDQYEEADEVDEYEEVDELEEVDAAEQTDEIDAWDETDEGDEADEESIDEAMAFALGAEDTDEFFGRLAKTLGRVGRGVVRGVRKAAPMIGKIARAVGPVASMIPGWGTAIGGVANVLGQLMADEASEEEALDAFAELAVRNRRAIPLVATMAARTVLGPRGASLPPAVRRQAVRQLRAAANSLVRQGGPQAIRALPRIARSVRRTAVARRTPVGLRPRVVANTIRRLTSQGYGIQRRLVRPSATGRRVINRVNAAVRAGTSPARAIRPRYGSGLGTSLVPSTYYGGSGVGRRRRRRGRTIVLNGPVRIVIGR